MNYKRCRGIYYSKYCGTGGGGWFHGSIEVRKKIILKDKKEIKIIIIGVKQLKNALFHC